MVEVTVGPMAVLMTSSLEAEYTNTRVELERD
jgi:hypothetical protein